MSVYRNLKYVLSAKQKKGVAGLLVLVFIGALLEALGVGIIVPLVSVVVSPEEILNNAKVLTILKTVGMEGIGKDTFIRILLIATIVVFVLKNLYLLLMVRLQAGFAASAQSETSVRLISDYLHRPYEFYLNAETGDIMRTFHSDIPHVFELLQEVMLLLTEMAVSVCLCFVLIIVDLKMTIAIAALLLVMVLVILFAMKPRLGKLGADRVRQQADTMKWMTESIGGIKDVKVAAKEPFFIRAFDRSYRALAVTGRRYTVLNSMPRLIIETVCIVGMLLYMFVLVLNGGDLMEKLPQLSAFALAAVRLMPSVNRISSHLSAIAYFEPSLNVLCENLDVSSLGEIDLKEPKIERKRYEKEICLKGISYHYPNSEKMIFDHADLTIPVGASVGVIGTSGAGKTTIVDILLGLLRPQEGMITVDGQTIDGTDPAWLSNVGYIAQNIYMLDTTIRANVAFGVNPAEADEKRIWEVLREAQMEEFVRSLPDGLDTEIGDRGVRVSGGQRQRIGIARALYHDPELLVFDEATSALDNDTEAAIMDAVGALKGRKTMVIIAHRLKTIENCDLLYRVQNGKIERTTL